MLANYAGIQKPFEGAIETLSHLYPLLKYIPDYYSYCSQLFLMIDLALERYIIICRGVQAKAILTTKRRRMLYSVTLVASIAVPSIYLIDHVLNATITSEKYQMIPMGMQVSTGEGADYKFKRIANKFENFLQ